MMNLNLALGIVGVGSMKIDVYKHQRKVNFDCCAFQEDREEVAKKLLLCFFRS